MKVRLNGKKSKKGFSLIEAIISLALVMIFIVGIFDALFTIQKVSIDVSLGGQAEIFAKNNLYEFGHRHAWNFTATSSGEISVPEPFRSYIKITDITPCRRKVESTVAWNTDNSQKTKEVAFSSLFGSFENLNFLGGDCGGNDLRNSISTTTPLSATSQLYSPTLKLTGVDIFDHNAFVSAISSDESAPDLLITDISIDAGENFHVISALDFGVGVNNLDVADGHVFAAVNNSTSQLAIINVRNPSTPFLISSSTLPSVSGSRPEGWSIYYYDSKIYIGTKRTAGHEFHIYDVSNPVLPVWLGSKEVNHNINSIIVRQGIAYLATSGNTKDLIVLDVHNPANIIEKTSLDLPGSEDGKSLYLLGNTLYLGRFKSLNNSGHHEFYALDISNISSVATSGSISVIGFYDTRADINSIKVVGYYAFLGTSDILHGFSIVDISSSTPVSTPMTFVNSVNLLSKITGIDYENGTVVISSFDTGEISQINLNKF